MSFIDTNKINFRCSYEGVCMAGEEQCKRCSDYVCDYEEIHNQPTIDNAKHTSIRTMYEEYLKDDVENPMTYEEYVRNKVEWFLETKREIFIQE